MSKVKCYNCNQYGHISRMCQKPRKPRKENMHVTRQDENPQQTVKEKAAAILRSLADEDDEVKDLVFKQLGGDEGFQDA